jgi:hypothetical protein
MSARPPTRREMREADETIVYCQGIIHDLLVILYRDVAVEDRAATIKKAEAVLPPNRRVGPKLKREGFFNTEPEFDGTGRYRD